MATGVLTGAPGRAVATRGLRRTFGAREVLRGIDVELRPGEFVALLGRSGSGKTTLLRILAGLDSGAEGTAQVAERRSVVFQDARLLPWASVLDNVVLGLGAGPGRRAAEVGLAATRRLAQDLSGGEAQRPRWPGRWCASRSCCCSTSPSVRSTRSPG